MFKLAERSDVLIEIYDIAGVIHKQISADGTDLVEVDITDLADNVYFYKVTVNNRSTVGKLLKD